MKKMLINTFIRLIAGIIVITLFLLIVYLFSFVYNFLLNNFYIITIAFIIILVVLFIYYLKTK